MGQEEADRFRQPVSKLYKDVLAAYAFYLTAMLASGFAREKKKVPRTAESSPLALFGVALLISLLWNGFVIGRIAQMAFWHSLDIQTLSEWLDWLTKDFGWLATPWLVFYFGSERS